MSKQATIHSFFRPASQGDDNLLDDEITLSELAAREKKLLKKTNNRKERRNRTLQQPGALKRDRENITTAAAAAAASNGGVQNPKREHSTSVVPSNRDEEDLDVENLDSHSASTTAISHLEGDRTCDTKPIPIDQQRSILYHLNFRSTHGGKMRFTEQDAPGLLLPEWQPCHWLVLQTKNPQCVAFSHDGVLLAIACERTIHVFDWDTVMASDMKGRLDRKKDILLPILSFRVPYLVSHLLWNKEDHLLVGYRGAVEIHIYNMGRIAEHDGTFVPSSATAAACMKCRPSNHVPKSRTPKCLTFLGLHHICAAYPCGHVCLWQSLDAGQSRGLLVWCWKCNQTVSCIQPLSNNWLLLGGANGDFTIVDWKTCRRKSFASDKTPTIVTTCRIPSSFPTDTVSPRDLAVQNMTIDVTRTTDVEHLPSSCRVSWVTAGGWALAMTLSPNTHEYGRFKKIEILASPPLLKTKTFDGEHVPAVVPKYSTTTTPILCSNDAYVWQTVPQTTIILPPHDYHQVCQDRQVLHSKTITLSCIDGRSIPLKQPPTALVVHPSREWMIVGTPSKIIILNARPKVESMALQNSG